MEPGDTVIGVYHKFRRLDCYFWLSLGLIVLSVICMTVGTSFVWQLTGDEIATWSCAGASLVSIFSASYVMEECPKQIQICAHKLNEFGRALKMFGVDSVSIEGDKKQLARQVRYSLVTAAEHNLRIRTTWHSHCELHHTNPVEVIFEWSKQLISGNQKTDSMFSTAEKLELHGEDKARIFALAELLIQRANAST